MREADIYWAIHPQAHADAAAKILAFMQALQIRQGPAEDAEQAGLPIQVTEGVAIIPIMGLLVRRAPGWAQEYGIFATDRIKMAVELAGMDPTIENIMLRIDSPGGSVSGLAELGDVLSATAKPITAQIEGMAASAAYYVASQADRIYMGRGDLVGSIGTRIMLYDYHKWFEENGIKAIPIDTGPFKSAGAMGTEITEEQQADFQRIVDFYFDDFVAMVAKGRNMTTDAVLAVGDGRVFTPPEALSAGLVDAIQTFSETFNQLRAAPNPGRSTQASRNRLAL